MESENNLIETPLRKKYIYKGKILNLRADEVLLPDKSTAKREIVEHGGGAAVLAVKDEKVLFVKQFRYAFSKSIYEIPAGKLENGEKPSNTAARELEEECGYRAKKLIKLCAAYASPGYSTEVIHIFKAEDIEKTHKHLDKDEFLISEWIEKDKIKTMIKDGEICDAKTLIALSYILDL